MAAGGAAPSTGAGGAVPTTGAGGAGSTWWPWLRMLAGLAILLALVTLLGTDAFADGLRVVGPRSVLAALGIGLATTVLTALRWRLVARRLGLHLGLAAAVAETYRALFLNAVLPGGVLGDVDRAVRHGRGAGDIGRAGRAVAIERVAGQVVLLSAVAVLLPVQPALVLGIADRLGAPAVGILAAVALLVVVLVLARSGSGAGRWRRMLATTAADLRAGALARTVWPALLGLSAAALAGYLAMFVLAARAAGVTAPTLDLLPPLLLALVAMGLPINIGGWGPREGVAALAFWMAGLGAPVGVTTSVAYGALALLAALPGGILLLARRVGRSGQGSAEPPGARPGRSWRIRSRLVRR